MSPNMWCGKLAFCLAFSEKYYFLLLSACLPKDSEAHALVVLVNPWHILCGSAKYRSCGH